MKKYLSLLSIALLGLLLYFFFFNTPDKELTQAPTHEKSVKEASKEVLSPPSQQLPLPKKSKQDDEQIVQKKPISPKEQSLAKFSNLFYQTLEESKDSTQLKELLEEMQLRPIISKDRNPYTGSMAIIRTKSVLPGTRYFHAQFFEDENGQGILQHMSFEFQPGPDAMKQAVEKIRSQFNLKVRPDFQKPGFVSWNLPKGRIIWVQEMQEKDLKDNPFNAYTPKDVGTIRVAVELEIHDGPEHGHITQ